MASKKYLVIICLYFLDYIWLDSMKFYELYTKSTQFRSIVRHKKKCFWSLHSHSRNTKERKRSSYLLTLSWHRVKIVLYKVFLCTILTYYLDIIFQVRFILLKISRWFQWYHFQQNVKFSPQWVFTPLLSGPFCQNSAGVQNR